MQRDDFVAAAYKEATGESVAPSASDDSYLLILAAGNRYIQQWQNMQDWNSLFDEIDISPITATNIFTFDTTKVRKISTDENARVRVTKLDTSYTDYMIVAPRLLRKYEYSCARVQNKLKFHRSFSSTSTSLGGTITIPFYGYAKQLTAATDVVPVDDPMWLVYMAAAAHASTDFINKGNVPDLIARANAVYEQMVLDNKEPDSEYVDHSGYEPLGLSV